MEKENSESGGIAIKILLALSLAHFLNDLLQSIITASYPLLKEELGLTFSQIGLITLVYQIAASIFQPVAGMLFDRWPNRRSIQIATCFTMTGLLVLSFASEVGVVMGAVALVGIGSAILHPEASRVTSLASGGKRGFAQSVFQVGGNLGGSLGPLLVAWLVAPYTRSNIAFFAILSVVGLWTAMPIVRWYGGYLKENRASKRATYVGRERPFGTGKTAMIIGVLSVLIFSKYIYMASLTNYYTFYLIEKFGVSVQTSQVCLFVFLFATAAGTLVGGPVGDKIGRKYVIWISILGCAPFSLLMPHVGTDILSASMDAAFCVTVALSFCAGFMLSSAFPAILLYSQELLPQALGLVSGLFFGFAFGVAGISAAILGHFADIYGVEAVYGVCGYMPLIGIVAIFLPNLQKK